jgi:hypothetical protein
MERDIVQFVEFRKFAHNPVELARETLAEIPGQLVDFMAKKRATPIKQTPQMFGMESMYPEMSQIPPPSFYAQLQSTFRNTMTQRGVPPEKVLFFPSFNNSFKGRRNVC